MARTQKNKATNYHLGTLKAKLAKLRNELLVEQSGGSSGGGGEGFDVARLGDARVALIGFPSVGKSTLLSALTSTESETVSIIILWRMWLCIVSRYRSHSYACTRSTSSFFIVGCLRVYDTYVYSRNHEVQGQ